MGAGLAGAAGVAWAAVAGSMRAAFDARARLDSSQFEAGAYLDLTAPVVAPPATGGHLRAVG
ncbi:hypothetical protein SAMN05443575_0246 [Jatrophihabitans endophyticus]|uniref:Uncharacterized protein n=1 Tax=Jatrophihabitans endophyticus TaxID=1206085 RepID=A0A1M5CHL2_9ACTN|nr:hypothetical protein [Jatrophihabitans endophyticus]SHF54186.1 hypothetical protein SAMN05443575_0246 [Jatrophihabitans endophyticus]